MVADFGMGVQAGQNPFQVGIAGKGGIAVSLGYENGFAVSSLFHTNFIGAHRQYYSE